MDEYYEGQCPKVRNSKLIKVKVKNKEEVQETNNLEIDDNLSKRIIIATVPENSNITIKNREIEYNVNKFEQLIQPEGLYETKISNVKEQDLKLVIKVILKDANNNDKTIDTIVYLREQKELLFFANAEISTESYYKIIQQDRLQDEEKFNQIDLFNSVTFIDEEKDFMNYVSVYDVLKDLDTIFAEFEKNEEYKQIISKKIKRHLKKIGLNIYFDYDCFLPRGIVKIQIIKYRYDDFGQPVYTCSEFDFYENNDDIVIKNIFEDRFGIGEEILLLIGKELLEIFKILKQNESLLNQNSRIKTLNYNAFLLFSNRKISYNADAFNIEMKIPFDGYEYHVSSLNFAQVFADGKLEEILKRTYVDILDCPKYLQASLFNILEEKEDVFEEKKQEESKTKKLFLKRKK